LLEAHERDLAATNKNVEVVIILDFELGTKIPSGATVPSGFWKTIKINGKAVECYYFPNTKPATTDYKKFLAKTCF
jgi:DNA/RNA endonuclease G (NUC1)